MIKGFSEEVVEAVWRKGIIIPDRDPNVYRKDKCGATIHRASRERENVYAWEIDHIIPNGSDELHNLRPLQWENNIAKGDNLDGRWTCKVVN